MKTLDSVSNRQLYEAIMEVHRKIDEVVDNRVVPLERWQSKLMGQIAVIGTIAVFGVNLLVDWIREKIKGS